jgi:hypothetical protein
VVFRIDLFLPPVGLEQKRYYNIFIFMALTKDNWIQVLEFIQTPKDLAAFDLVCKSFRNYGQYRWLSFIKQSVPNVDRKIIIDRVNAKAILTEY